jgi:hypothetical protein
MSDFITELERDLVGAAGRRYAPARPTPGIARRPWRTVLLAAALLVLVAGVAAAATLVAVRGAVIPAPALRDAGPAQVARPGTARLAGVLAVDPAGARMPVWTLRLSRNGIGQRCVTAGQLVGGRFGLVGTDGRFRRIAAGVVDSCGDPRPGTVTLLGTRIFDAPRRADVRTVLTGLGGPALRGVTVAGPDGRRALRLGRDGAFVAAFRGYSEDAPIHVDLRFTGGRHERYAFGVSREVTPDPLGGPAWEPSNGSQARSRASCVGFGPARATAGPLDRLMSPPACGLRNRQAELLSPGGIAFAVQTLRHQRSAGGGHWHTWWDPAYARTAVWGQVDHAHVRSLTIIGAPGGPRRIRPQIGGTFLAVFPPSVPPRDLSVWVHYVDGRSRTFHGDTNLVPVISR